MKKTREIIKNGLFVCLYFIVMFAPLNKLLPKNMNQEEYSAAIIFMNVAIDGFFVILGIILFFSFLKKDGQNVSKNWGRTFAMVGLFVLISYGCNMVGSLISSLLGGEGTSVNQSSIESLIKSKYGWLLIINVIIFGPIMEEFIFRKSLTEFLKDMKIPKAVVWVIVACLFGLIHVVSAGDYIMVFPYIGMGLALGAIQIYTDNIYPSIIIHIFMNALATLMLFL